MNFDYNSFYKEAHNQFLKGNHTERYGQFLMNYLSDNHPGVFIGMPEECDCFFNNTKVPALLRYLITLS